MLCLVCIHIGFADVGIKRKKEDRERKGEKKGKGKREKKGKGGKREKKKVSPVPLSNIIGKKVVLLWIKPGYKSKILSTIDEFALPFLEADFKKFRKINATS